ncbi:hypothetical protein D9Q98_008280 [Chlorella vulgaris]|uniref:Uncharacterized protein n=1 Tax=Chlorella vulgaris TaxID=3077 RepID=A0A9D4YSX6_CHLVU|nr:hypothetical protein D9Q98_008280 [Chlorella vulgaris]
MVSQTTTNILGIIGGVVLAICQAPQLIKLYRTKSAADLSYWYLALYSIGLLFITVYMYLEKATVGWICESIETVCGFALIALKYYYDEHGPLSARGKRRLGMKGDTSNGAVPPTCTCTGLQGKAALLQPRSLKQPPMGTDTGSDGSEVSGMEMGISSAGGGLPTRSRRERRRSHDTLPM